MKDFSEVTDLETARKILIGYDEAFMKGAAEIERLQKVAQPQPMETAPKDGTEILIYGSLYENPKPNEMTWCVVSWSLLNDYWDYDGYKLHVATCWTSLPDPIKGNE